MFENGNLLLKQFRCVHDEMLFLLPCAISMQPSLLYEIKTI